MPGHTAHAYLTPGRLHQLPRDPQPHPEPAVVVHIDGPLESLEYPLLVGFRDPDAMVFDSKPSARLVCADLDLNRPVAPDRYELAGVEKVGPSDWRFNARMIHGPVDVTVPVVVPIQWAGDTPMITMTDVSIPTLGTFTARVFFYEDRYAGTWQHGTVGGHMFGRIEKKK